jgi:hypothetical protein
MRLFLWATLAASIAVTEPLHAQDQPRAFQGLYPTVHRCFEIFRFESIPVNHDKGTFDIMSDRVQLTLHYTEVVGWLQGYFTARNNFDLSSDGDITRGTKPLEWMNWIYSYCRSHPSGTMIEIANELARALQPQLQGQVHSTAPMR